MKKSTEPYVAKTEDIQEIKRYLIYVLRSYTNTWGTATQLPFFLKFVFISKFTEVTTITILDDEFSWLERFCTMQGRVYICKRV